MLPDTPAINSSLAEKFETVWERFAEFTQDLGKMHNAMPVHNDAARAVFSSVSRLTAFSDQARLILSLMREDIRVIDELTSDPVTVALTGQIEHCFYEWLRSSRAAASNVN